MKAKMSLEWLLAAGIRALRTVAQTALGMFTVGVAISDVDWKYVISVSAVSGIFSLLTSLATSLPEVGSDGTLQIDTSSPVKDTYRIMLDTELDVLSLKKQVKLVVDPKADLSQQ